MTRPDSGAATVGRRGIDRHGNGRRALDRVAVARGALAALVVGVPIMAVVELWPGGDLVEHPYGWIAVAIGLPVAFFTGGTVSASVSPSRVLRSRPSLAGAIGNAAAGGLIAVGFLVAVAVARRVIDSRPWSLQIALTYLLVLLAAPAVAAIAALVTRSR